MRMHEQQMTKKQPNCVYMQWWKHFEWNDICEASKFAHFLLS